MENEQSNWSNSKNVLTTDTLLNQYKLVDDASIRGTRLLSNVYDRCNVAILEPEGYHEAMENPKWRTTV